MQLHVIKVPHAAKKLDGLGLSNLHYEKFADGTVKCIEDEIPFELPQGWAWSRLEPIASLITDYVANGSFASLKANVRTYKEKNYALFVRTVDFASDFKGDLSYIDKESYDFLEKSKLFGGELMLSNIGASIGKVFKVPRFDIPMSLAPNAIILRFFNDTTCDYFEYVFKSFVGQDYLQFLSGGAAMPKFNKTDLRAMIVPIPPMSEQAKIVEAVKRTFSFIDDLDVSYCGLTATIQSVKSKVLDLAIRGKLVPQNPDDEPASVLLERIRAEKEELIKRGKIKHDKKESVIFKGEDNSYYEKIGNEVACIDAETPFDPPAGWAWCRGYSCFSGMETRRPDGDTFRYIDIDSIDNKAHKIKHPKTIATKDAPSRASRAVQSGSVLFSFVRPYLENIAYIDDENKDCIASTGFYICNSNGILYPPFMYYLMLSEYVIQGLNQFMKGDNSPSINKDNIENWLYPIPPINEQKLICSKLEELISFISTIEKSLS